MHGNEICKQNHAIQIMIVLCEIEERILPTHTANDPSTYSNSAEKKKEIKTQLKNLERLCEIARGQTSMIHRMAVSIR